MLQARLPFTQQAVIAPLDLYWLVSCNGKSAEPADQPSWLPDWSGHPGNASAVGGPGSPAAEGSRQAWQPPDLRLAPLIPHGNASVSL